MRKASSPAVAGVDEEAPWSRKAGCVTASGTGMRFLSAGFSLANQKPRLMARSASART